MEKILFPTDFSNLSRHALKHVVNQLKEQKKKCTLILLNTYYPPESFSEDLVIKKHDEARNISAERIRKELEQLQKDNPDSLILFEGISQLGSLENVIDYLVKSKGITAIFIPQQNEDEKKLKNIICPIFLIPHS